VSADGIKNDTRRCERPLFLEERPQVVMMKRRRKSVLLVLLLAAVLTAAAILMIRVGREPEKALLKIMSDKVDLQVRNVHFTEVGDSGMKWDVKADTARYQKKENLAFFEKIIVKLVMKDGRTFLMNGDRGSFRTDSRDMEIEGNVGIVSENGDRFTTDRLRYINTGKVIETDRPVSMENDHIRVIGVGMVFPLDGNKVSLLSQVRAISGGK
jgi:LPS export ABC transporter protein LptC